LIAPTQLEELLYLRRTRRDRKAATAQLGAASAPDEHSQARAVDELDLLQIDDYLARRSLDAPELIGQPGRRAKVHFP